VQTTDVAQAGKGGTNPGFVIEVSIVREDKTLWTLIQVPGTRLSLAIMKGSLGLESACPGHGSPSVEADDNLT
jgi:hypothetical protein